MTSGTSSEKRERAIPRVVLILFCSRRGPSKNAYAPNVMIHVFLTVGVAISVWPSLFCTGRVACRKPTDLLRWDTKRSCYAETLLRPYTDHLERACWFEQAYNFHINSGFEPSCSLVVMALERIQDSGTYERIMSTRCRNQVTEAVAHTFKISELSVAQLNNDSWKFELLRHNADGRQHVELRWRDPISWLPVSVD